MQDKFYITTPIYYASGNPHIGHAFTTLYADVVARRKRKAGFEVFFLTGLDEHGSKVSEKAEEAGKQPIEFVNELAEKYLDLWKTLQIQNDDFIRTTSEKHKIGVYKFIEKISQSGDIYEGYYEGLYCKGCENFVFEKDLINGLCPDHFVKPELIKEKNYFFNLKKYLPIVREKIINNDLKIIPESRKNEIIKIIDSGIPDFSITREKVKWGIDYPYDKAQKIYVWVEALMNYVSALDFPDGENYKKFWPVNAHIIGVDINKFHSVFWPALLLSVKAPLPKKIFVHSLFTVNGQKMGKALGNVIDPAVVVNKFDSDAARYLILSQFPASEHGDIKEGEFVEKYNADLANGIGNLFERIFTMVVKYGDVKKIKIDIFDSEIKKTFEGNFKNYESYMENFQLFEALKEIFSFVRFIDKYINEKSPWELYKHYRLINPVINNSYIGRIVPLSTKNNEELKNEIDEILSDLMLGVEKIILLLEPFMPSKMKFARNFLDKLKSGGIKPDEKLNLFPRALS